MSVERLSTKQILWLLALICVGLSSMMGSVNYITTIINLRAPGMTLFRMPLSIWAMFMPGARYPWPELVERVTGQSLGVDALAAAVAWPRAE